MAVPVYITDLVDVYLDDGVWDTVGGGRVTDVETDDYIQGSNCWSHDPFSSGIEGGAVESAQNIDADSAAFIWTKCDVAATLATHANGGIQILIGNSLTALKCFYALGSDDYKIGGWKCIPVDPTLTPSTNIGTPSGVTDFFGVRWNVPATGASKGYPMKIDAIRHGRQIEVTAGDATTPASWSSTAIYDSEGTRQWGICQPTNAGAQLQGIIIWGTQTTAVHSRDSNKTIEIIDTEWTVSDFTKIVFDNTSNDIVWDNVSLLALGTNNRGIIDVLTNCSVTWTNSVFGGIDISNLQSDCIFDGSKWLSTNEVTASGTSLLKCKILTPTIAADTAALIWDSSIDTDGLLDGMEFSKGTNAHHAISFTNSTNVEYTLRNMDFVGFNASDANNDSTLYFPDSGSDTDWIINTFDCSGDISYKKVRAGDTVTIVADPVTLTLTVKDEDGLVIVGAFAYIDDDNASPYIMNTTTNASGIATTSWSGGAVPGSTWRVRKYGYKPYKATVDIPASGTIGLPVTLVSDPQQT